MGRRKTKMCNLYKLSRTQDEVAQFFDGLSENLTVAPAGNAPEQMYPGYPGMVMDGERLRQMAWGFPLERTGAKGQPLKPKPVNNARSDKLTSPFWSASFRERRCLIPVSAWAEAEGQRGSMTRTWLSARDTPLMAIAGLWRETDEWGPAYSMIMTDAAPPMRAIHHRMPVILAPSDWQTFLHAPVGQAHALCRPWPGDLAIERTDKPWFSKG